MTFTPFYDFFVNFFVLLAHLGTAAAVSTLFSMHIGKFPQKVFDAHVILLILRCQRGPFLQVNII